MSSGDYWFAITPVFVFKVSRFIMKSGELTQNMPNSEPYMNPKTHKRRILIQNHLYYVKINSC